MQFPTDLLKQCWFLAGPTAVGKSELSLALAERLNAEILALDSMSLYRGMDIGTAKPSPEQRRRVPHHLIDILEPHEEYSLAQYVGAAKAACEEIVARGRTPLFVGGAGLYLRGLLRGVFEGPPADWNLRRELQQFAEEHGDEALHRRLAEIDPASAGRLHPRDRRRVIRALEVYRQTSRPLSEQQQQSPLPPQDRPRHVYWLEPERSWLHERINRRVEQMMAAGLVDEVRRLLSAPQPISRTARQALGYREVIDTLEQGGDWAETIHRIQTNTRQFAKRQHTWFRNLVECTAIPVRGDESPDELIERILDAAGGSP